MNRRDALKGLLSLPLVASGVELPVAEVYEVQLTGWRAIQDTINPHQLKIEFYTRMVREGTLSPNEIRRMES